MMTSDGWHFLSQHTVRTPKFTETSCDVGLKKMPDVKNTVQKILPRIMSDPERYSVLKNNTRGHNSMPTIAEASQQLAVDGVPVLLIDTCVLLDVIRAPLRKIRDCISSAVELTEMQARSRCRIVVSSMIQNEWSAHEQAVMNELDHHFALRDQDADAFHEACAVVNIPLAFGQASYQTAGLAGKLRDLSADLLKNAMHLLPS